MADFILMEGDTVQFDPTFGMAVVVVQPGKLTGSGPATLQQKKFCVAGDEAQVAVPGCMYTTSVHAIPGTGTLKIAALGGDQKATKTNSGGKPILLKGTKFQAKFEVQNPAKQPPPTNTPDPTPMHAGTGQFITQNGIFQAT